MVKRLTTDQFTQKAILLHGDKYTYDRVEYVKSTAKVWIGCKVHGYYNLTPKNHLRLYGCPRCIQHDPVTTKEFIKQAKKIHGDTYGYDRVEYVKLSGKVWVRCKLHGYFEVAANLHLHLSGCAKCGGSEPKDTKTFIEQAINSHGNKFLYDKVIYTNSKSKVSIGCKIHGYFEQEANAHLNGHGCIDCTGFRKLTTKSFIEKARLVHGSRYLYSKSNYQGADEQLVITCKQHGNFYQKPHNHLSGRGCWKCAGNKKLTEPDFIQRSLGIHRDKYDYSKVNYQNSHNKVLITCKKHGDFLQSPTDHLSGLGCKKCGRESTSKRLAKTVEAFVEESRIVHGCEYGYTRSTYINIGTKLIITCKKHGDFRQTPATHLRGSGCPKCKNSKLEKVALDVLRYSSVKHKKHFRFSELGRLSYDFYLPKHKILIEMDGEQHFRFVEYFHRNQKGWLKQQYRDQEKDKFARRNGYTLIRIPYNAKPSPKTMLIAELEKHGVFGDFEIDA